MNMCVRWHARIQTLTEYKDMLCHPFAYYSTRRFHDDDGDGGKITATSKPTKHEK